LFQIAKETPMLRTFVNGKIHQLKVTGLQPKYSGSIAETLRYKTAADALVRQVNVLEGG
jgi:aspartate 1-decarboxylase